SATDPSSIDQSSSFTYAINWGDGQTSAKARAPRSTNFTHYFVNAGTYTITLTTTDKDFGETTITRTVRVLPVISANMQTVINQQGSIAFQVTNNTQAQDVVTAVNDLAIQTTPVTITLNLSSGIYSGTTPLPKAGITLKLIDAS